jgi:hypothetical protein
VLSCSLVSLLVYTQLEQRDTEPDMEMRWKINSMAAKCWLILSSCSQLRTVLQVMVWCSVQWSLWKHSRSMAHVLCLSIALHMYIWRENSNFGDWCSVSTWRFKIPFPSDHCNLQWSSFHVSIASEILKFCGLQSHTWSAIFATSQSLRSIFMLLVSSWCFFHIQPLAASPVLSMPLA